MSLVLRCLCHMPLPCSHICTICASHCVMVFITHTLLLVHEHSEGRSTEPMSSPPHPHCVSPARAPAHGIDVQCGSWEPMQPRGRAHLLPGLEREASGPLQRPSGCSLFLRSRRLAISLQSLPQEHSKTQLLAPPWARHFPRLPLPNP